LIPEQMPVAVPGLQQALRTMRLSASQVQTFSDCQRKWAWRYVAGVEEPPNASAELGRNVHGVLEQYLNGGEIDFTTEIGYIAASGLEHLPKPGTPGLLVEQEFHFIGPSGHSYLGYKDLELPGAVYDHKTTSNLRWQKTEDELRKDIQATLYAVDYFRKHPEESDVELRWVYYQTKNTKKSAITKIRVNQEEAWSRFLDIEKTAEQMALASTQEPLDLPANVNHCSAYGGCPHQGRCNLSPFDKMRSYVEQSRFQSNRAAVLAPANGEYQVNKLTSLLKNKANGATAPAAAAAAGGQVPSLAFQPGGAHHGVLPTPPATPPAAAPAAGGNKLLAKMRSGGAPAAQVAPAAAPVAPAAAPVAPVAPVAATAPVAPSSPSAAINPPEYQPPPTAAPALTAEAAGRELAESLQQGESAGGAQAEKRGRGRPTKAVVPATGLVPKIKTLYINCGPVGATVVDASQLIVLAKQRILTEVGLADYRFAEYGQGPGMLAIAVVAELDALEGMIGAVRLDTVTPEGAIVAVELMARAELVVR